MTSDQSTPKNTHNGWHKSRDERNSLQLNDETFSYEDTKTPTNEKIFILDGKVKQILLYF
jgi:hypothetical protein